MNGHLGRWSKHLKEREGERERDGDKDMRSRKRRRERERERKTFVQIKHRCILVQSLSTVKKTNAKRLQQVV